MLKTLKIIFNVLFLASIISLQSFAQGNDIKIGEVLSVQSIFTFNKQGFPIEKNTHNVDINELFNSLENKVRERPVIEIHKDKIFIGFSKHTNDLSFPNRPGIYGYIDHALEITAIINNEEVHIILPPFITHLGGWWEIRLFVFEFEEYHFFPQSNDQLNQKMYITSEFNDKQKSIDSKLDEISQKLTKGKYRKAQLLIDKISNENLSYSQYARLETQIQRIDPGERKLRTHFLKGVEGKLFEDLDEKYSKELEIIFGKKKLIQLTQKEYVDFVNKLLEDQIKNFDRNEFYSFRELFYISLDVLSKDLIYQLIANVNQASLIYYFENYDRLEGNEHFVERFSFSRLINNSLMSYSYIASNEETIQLYKNAWYWFSQNYPHFTEEQYGDVVNDHFRLVYDADKN